MKISIFHGFIQKKLIKYFIGNKYLIGYQENTRSSEEEDKLCDGDSHAMSLWDHTILIYFMIRYGK